MSTPYGGRIIRNLLYHLWPTKANGMWRWNVSQLLRRIEQFDGQRIVSVVTGPGTDTLAAVKEAFQGTVTDFIHHRNDPSLGEVVSFEELMHRVENIDPRQLTFYAHGKGAKYAPGEQPMVKRWCEVMYSNMLDYPGLIEDALRFSTLAGTFYKTNNSFGGLPQTFHYAGTFFWLRNQALFAKDNWRHIAKQWWGVEAWPGVVCKMDEAACMLYKGEAPEMHMYPRHHWNTKYNPAWYAWQVKHGPLHRPCSYKELLTTLRLTKAKQIIVTGPQRSGTTIASKILAAELALPWYTEATFDTHDLEAFHQVVRNPAYVMQAPTMVGQVHHLTQPTIVWMSRNLQDILRSQERIQWGAAEGLEKDRYFTHDSEPVAAVKLKAWERFQRPALGDRAFDLDYESLKSHPMWVDKEERAGFRDRQTCYPPVK